MARESAAVLTLTCLLALVLLIVTCCSAPASRAISLFSISLGTPNQGSKLDVGILGVCLQTSLGIGGLCSRSTLGFQILMTTPSSGGPLGFSSGWAGRITSGGISNFGSAQVLVDEDLTRAMIFSPLGAAAAGLATLVSLAAWVSSGNKGLEIAAIVLAAFTAVFSWVAFAINIAISGRVKQGVDDLQRYLSSSQDLSFTWGAATFLPLGAAVVASAALGWAIFEFQSRHTGNQRRESESANPLSYERNQSWSEKQMR